MDFSILILGFILGLGLIASFLGGILFAKSESKENKNETSDYAQRDLVSNELMNNLAAAVILRDSVGKISYCSPYIEVLTGYAREEIYKNSEDFFLTICHPHEKERLYRSLKVSELSGEPFQFQFQFYHKSGIEMWAESRTVPLFDAQSEISGSLSVTLDITAMMSHQKMVEEKNKELKEFTSMVSHDLKAPIYTINGLIDVIKEDFKEEIAPAALEIFSTIEKAGRRLEQLVQSILDYARLGAKDLTLEPVSFVEIIETVLAEQQHLIEKKKAKIIQISIPKEILGDSSSLIQIFSNLIGNALKYSHPNRPPEIEISTHPSSHPQHICIDIKDNGIGIPNDRLSDVFRPFVRIHSNDGDGTGIGLATVKKLIHKMGANIELSSSDAGSIFTINIRGK